MATIEQNFRQIESVQKWTRVFSFIYLGSAIVSAFLGHWPLAIFMLILWLGVVINNGIRTLMQCLIALSRGK